MHARHLGHAMADQDGIITHVDPAFCRILGRPRGDLVGRHVLDITHPADRDDNRAAIASLLSERRPYWMDKRYLRGDGSAVQVRNHVSYFHGADGALHLIATVFETGSSQAAADERQERAIFDALDKMAKATRQ